VWGAGSLKQGTEEKVTAPLLKDLVYFEPW